MKAGQPSIVPAAGSDPDDAAPYPTPARLVRAADRNHQSDGASPPTLCHRGAVPDTIFTIGHSNVGADQALRARPRGNGIDANSPTCARIRLAAAHSSDATSPRRARPQDRVPLDAGARRTAPRHARKPARRAWQVPAFAAYADLTRRSSRRRWNALEVMGARAPTAYLCPGAVVACPPAHHLGPARRARGWDVSRPADALFVQHRAAPSSRVDGSSSTRPG